MKTYRGLPVVTLEELTAGMRRKTREAEERKQAAAVAPKLVVDYGDSEWDTARRVDQSGMCPAWRAWKEGYEAAARGESVSANPYLRPGESPERPTYPIAGGWNTGWFWGQGRKPEDVDGWFTAWKKS